MAPILTTCRLVTAERRTGVDLAYVGRQGPRPIYARRDLFVEIALGWRHVNGANDRRAMATASPEAHRTGLPPRRWAAGRIPGP
jgi:hypothetical protein